MTAIDDLQNMLTASKKGKYLIPAIVCRDAFTFSMQASKHHYCSPRNNEGPWEKVELLLPVEDALLEAYRDGTGIYGYVPLEEVVALVNRHCGLQLK